jgi:hypothetical protein
MICLVMVPGAHGPGWHGMERIRDMRASSPPDAVAGKEVAAQALGHLGTSHRPPAPLTREPLL